MNKLAQRRPELACAIAKIRVAELFADSQLPAEAGKVR
jgi:hypothetical protein